MRDDIFRGCSRYFPLPPIKKIELIAYAIIVGALAAIPYGVTGLLPLQHVIRLGYGVGIVTFIGECIWLPFRQDL